MRKTNLEFPGEVSNKEIHSSSFRFTDDTTVVNYIPRKNKNVHIITSMHHDKSICSRLDKKP